MEVKNQRRFLSKFNSQIPTPLFNFMVAGFVSLFALLSFLLFSRLENVASMVMASYESESTTVFQVAMALSQVVFPSIFMIVALFIALIEVRRQKQIKDESFVLLSQIRSIKDGNYSDRRGMRPYDDFKDVLAELHSLCDHLSKK